MHLLLLALSLLAASGREPSIYPLLDRDARLRQTITLQRPPDRMGGVIHLLGEKTGVSLAVEGEFLNRPVAVEVRDRQARDVMTDIALLARGTWIKRNGGYLLMQNGTDVFMVQAGPGTARAHDATNRLVASLTPGQLGYMQSGHPLLMSQLTDTQKHWLAIALIAEFYRRPEHYPRTMLTEQPGELRLLTMPDGEPMIALCAPQVTDQGISPPLPFLTRPLQPHR